MRISDIILMFLVAAATLVLALDIFQTLSAPSKVEDTLQSLQRSIDTAPLARQQLDLQLSSLQRVVRVARDAVAAEESVVSAMERDLAAIVARKEADVRKAVAEIASKRDAEEHHEARLDLGFAERVANAGPLEAFPELSSLEAIVGGRVDGLDPFKGYAGSTWASQTLSLIQGVSDRVVDLKKRCSIQHIDSQFRRILHLWGRNFEPDFTPIYRPIFAPSAQFHASHERGVAGRSHKDYPL